MNILSIYMTIFCGLIIQSSAFEFDSWNSDDVICPPTTECYGCDLSWTHPGLSEEDVLVGTDLCTVTISWNWPFNASYTGPNPRLVFDCQYDNGDPCNTGNEEVCGSCKSITFTGLHPSQNPSLVYSDTCGNAQTISIAKNCLPPTNPPTEPPTNPPTEPPTNPPTEPPTTAIATEENTTPFETSTIEIETTELPESSTADVVTTPGETSTAEVEATTDNYYCPSVSECTECPATWNDPIIYEEDIAVGEDACDVTLFWDSDQASVEGGPRLRFSCIYGETGEYCKPIVDMACASCETVTLEGLKPSLKPIVHYVDSCGYSDEFMVAENCVYQEPTTPEPESYCPETSECSGCPDTWTDPTFQITGGPLVNNTCDIAITWGWDYSPIDEIQNPRLTFQCIYEANGEFCSDKAKGSCGSCEEVIFTDVREDLEPYINYADTCGSLKQLDVGEVCY